MKKGIHPNYHFVNVQLNDGTAYRTRTTWGTPDQKLTLDIDPTTHPAWTGGQQQLLDRGGRLTRFSKGCLARYFRLRGVTQLGRPGAQTRTPPQTAMIRGGEQFRRRVGDRE